MSKKRRKPAPPPEPTPEPKERFERLRWLAISALSGTLWFLATASFDIWPLGWIAAVPALYALERASTNKRAILYGLMTGTVANAGGFYWIVTLLERFAQLPWYAAIPLYLLMCAYQGTVFMFFAWIARKIRQRTNLPMALVAPVVMVACELAVPFLFPWYIAITQAWQIHVIQIADLTGPLGVTALVMTVNGAIYDLATTRAKRWRPAAASAAILAAALGYGALRIHQAEARAAAAPHVQVGLVQGNVAFDEKGYEHPDFADKQLLDLQMQSQLLEKAGAELIVWTESAYPYLIPRRATHESTVRGQRTRVIGDDASRKRVKMFEAPLVFGAVTYEQKPDGAFDPEIDPYNSAIMLDSAGEFTGRFDKMFLVLFSEHIPFVDTFPFIRKILPRASGNFSRGKGVVTFPLHTAAGDFQLGPMICFEDIIPEYGRRLGEHHPDLMVNITNDAWFGDTSEPWEHLALSVYRAVEQRSEMVRAVNTGVSAFVDSTGRVVHRTYAVDPGLHPHPADRILGSVAMLRAGDTVYAKIGDVFGYACFAATVFLWLILPRLRRKKAP
jgi:apolipoprotein N-acyltransferase